MPFTPIILSVPTSGSGATPGATFIFVSSGYKTPGQGRSSTVDTVHNQNGVHRYLYDNGPNFREWDTFQIVCSDFPEVTGIVGRGATQQIADMDFLWQYVGRMGLQDALGTYTVVWAGGQPRTPTLDQYPTDTGDKIEMRYAIALEEG